MGEVCLADHLFEALFYLLIKHPIPLGGLLQVDVALEGMDGAISLHILMCDDISDHPCRCSERFCIVRDLYKRCATSCTKPLEATHKGLGRQVWYDIDVNSTGDAA